MGFDQAFNYTINIEGGYVNDKDDRGGETYIGISRVFNPSWKGWEIIDAIKKEHPEDFESYLYDNVILNSGVKLFYYKEYWLALNCDQLPELIGEELFDTAVNLGKTVAVKILQKSLNLLNRNGKLFADLLVDGIIGPITLSASYMVNEKRLLKVMNGYQFMYYANIMETDPLYEKYVGWFNRV